MDDIEKALLETTRLIAYGRQLLKQSKKMVRQSRNSIQQSRAAILNRHSLAAAPNSGALGGDAAPKSVNRFC